ncbi:type-F conjugative transfer system pilin assembly thiol-disulfide isomerase TrbB [Candidatus Fukatsuia symbiotica]|uniref:type-F conjugative transfer system pilin assembly thiol-disulfide isomerase TrbB n=1 Tax=Candidatus Fukatsuia TaxID=1927833 RepID=UPI000E74D7E0|nr:type-F conjugative transfer system pilin assembly thiol-disulfide isomerase TrbB [Candidatus Fukatsuia symbiotica]MEA9443946.1 type-F conjugative transfer system pilin assembly thiol-disulfide isomerase TrbB [Candidatus Fukatsuia symbiotica]
MKCFLMLALLLTGVVHASTWDDIAALDAIKMQTTREETKPMIARWFRLSNGRQVNLNHWKLVLFMQSACMYCQHFDPMLRKWSAESGLSVFPYNLDGQGDVAYPHALPAPPAVIAEFFQHGMPIATPTTFLVNVNTMETFPLIQGAVDKSKWIARLDAVFQMALNKGMQ